MNPPRPNELSLVGAVDAIACGQVSCVELVEACLEQISTREAVIGAWTHLAGEDALALAHRKDREGRTAGQPLYGIPIAIKDIIDTVDIPTECGSKIYAGRRPAWDAACVALLKKAGAIVLGKTITTEFAYFSPGKTVNPRNTKHTPGGSSSGSAAAVADMMVPAALGTQTAASVIRPASYCGTVGYKPSTGAFSLAGIKVLAESLDTLGLLTRSAADLSMLRAALLDRSEPALIRPRGGTARIGLCRTPWWNEASNEAKAAVEEAGSLLRAAGAEVEDLSLPAHFTGLADDQKLIMSFEAGRALAYEYNVYPNALSNELTDLIEVGLRTPYRAYIDAQERARHARIQLSVLTRSTFDALLAPSAKGSAPKGLASTGDPIFSRMWTLMHVPAICLPWFSGPDGLPVGIQLVGAFEKDDELIQLASWCEKELADAAIRSQLGR